MNRLSCVFACFFLAAGIVGLTALGQPPSEPPDSKNSLRTKQQESAEQFRRLKERLLLLAQRLAASEKPEERERAKIILGALDYAGKENVDDHFRRLIERMTQGSNNVQDLDRLLGQDAQLTKALQEMLSILLTDNESTRIKEEITKIEQALKETRDILRNQELIRAMIDLQKRNSKDVAKAQSDLASRTKELAERMGGEKKDGTQKESNSGKAATKDQAANSKPEAKPGEDAAEPKPDSEIDKSETKTTEPGSRNQSDKKDRVTKAEGPNSTKPAESRQISDSSQQSKSDTKPSQQQDVSGVAKPERAEKATSKSSNNKSSSKPKETTKTKPESDTESAKASSKPDAEEKGEDKNPSGEEPGEHKDSGIPKTGSQPKQKQTSSKPSPSESGANDPQNSSQQEQPQQAMPQPAQKQLPGRKQIQEAYPKQRAAEDKLKDEKRDEANKQVDQAIEQLNKAIQEMEKRLKQMREEETLKLLAGLEARCARMLQMQIGVYDATKAIDQTIQKAGNRTNADRQKSLQQADVEREIVREAEKTLRLLAAEGVSVAFARILEELRQDMMAITVRLDEVRVDAMTQEIETNVITMLKEMVASLKQQQEDMKQQQQQQQEQSSPQKSGTKALVNQIAELKLIRTLQTQVNSRTKLQYGRDSKEQTADPLIQKELKDLAERQVKLQEMIADIVSGRNK